jgi:hypothetical protein
MVRDSRKNDAGVDHARTGLQTEIEFIWFVETLRVALVRNPNVRENIEINQDAVLLLLCGMAVILE